MCTECMGFESDPKDCTSKYCPVFPYKGRTLVSIYENYEETKQKMQELGAKKFKIIRSTNDKIDAK